LRLLTDLKQTRMALHGPRGPNQAQHEYTPADLQRVQNYMDKIHEAIMILEANAVILTSLCKYYERLLDNKDFPLRVDCREDILSFATQIEDMIYDSKMQIARAKLLVQITNDRKSLVSINMSLNYILSPYLALNTKNTQVLQHLQSQATGKMETLTKSMHNIGNMAQKDANAMRVITIVTLIFLPATFVSVREPCQR
jgi:hypothetical protein